MEQPNNNQDQQQPNNDLNLQIDPPPMNAKQQEEFDFSEYDTLDNVNLQIVDTKFEDAEIDNYSSDDDDMAQNIDLLREQSADDHDYISPGGSLYWTPEVSDHIKPKIKSVYDSYVVAVRMYRNYALEAGFDVRLGTLRHQHSVLLRKDIYCVTVKASPTLVKWILWTFNTTSLKEEKIHSGWITRQRMF
uniref:FAR1 domain-containing protein n=1 Tax=Lactuca sativa TaxID=4236 RepID=A0A9R1XCJ8_LACSA|nr:hypothetical protein LSAT_V11C500283940 [Lactuca sativa]